MIRTGLRSAVLGLLVLLRGLAAAPSACAAPELPHFVEETDAAGLRSRFDGEDEYLVGGGVATFNCDASGLPSVYVTGGVNKARFFRNHSAPGGPIRLQEEHSGLEVTNAIGAYPIDIDGDGNTDLVVLRVGEVEVYRGLGDCRFARSNEAWNFRSSNGWHTAFSATWELGQEWPTLAIGTYVDRSRPDFPWGSCTPGLLLRPDGAARRFAAPLELRPGHCALSMLFSDWNRSGEAALRVSNDREYYKNGQEQLWHVAPGAAPTPYTAAEGWKPLQIWGMGIASQDIDGDGRPEVFLSSMADNKFQVLDAGTGQPSFSDQAYARGMTAHRPYMGGDIHPSTAWHAQFGDVNNDGYADLFIVKGNIANMPDFASLDPNNLLLQQADGHFVEVGDRAGIANFKRGRGGMLVDLNGDGLLDILVVNRWDKAQLWRNLGAGTAAAAQPLGHWVQVRLQQSGGNRDAIGAWVEVDLGTRVIRQELTIGGGHASGHLGWMHFGLGAVEQARLRVQWPHGEWSAWMPVQADRYFLVDREQGVQPWRRP